MSDKPKPRTISRTPDGRARTMTKPTAAGVVLPVTDPLDLWYLCEKASYAKATPYLRAKDHYPMYQRTVSRLVRLDNENFKYRFPYCGEVGFDMSKCPPQPIMSNKEPHRPSRFPLSQYQQLRNRHLEHLANMRVEIDLLSKSDLERILSPAPPSKSGMLWIDAQKKTPGLLRIPDVLRLRSFSNPSIDQYSQDNLVSVIEMKFPGDALSQAQQEAYEIIAGPPGRLRLLETKQCESGEKKQWREWIRASVSEPVYKPVGQVMSLASRVSAEKHKLLIGHIDAEHETARRLLEIQPAPPGTHFMKPAQDERAIHAQNQRAVAGIEMTLAAPFVAVGTIMAAMITAPTLSSAEGGALIASAGGQSIRFKPFIEGARRKLAGGAIGTGTAMPAFATPKDASSTSISSAEQQEIMARLDEWNQYQRHHATTIQNYVFWEDVPETKHD